MINAERIKVDYEIGRKILESVPFRFRPGWGISLVMVYDKLIKVPNEVKELYEIVDDEKRWCHAHNQFNEIRKFALNNKRFWPETYLHLTENVAKLTYNLSGYPAPFDIDSGWYLPSLSVQTAASFKNEELMEKTLKILTMHYKEELKSR